MTREHAQDRAAIVAAEQVDRLRTAAGNCTGRARPLAVAISTSVDRTDGIVDVDSLSTESLGGNVLWSTEGAQISALGQNGVPVSIWATSDLGWLFPDDTRLWQHLDHCLASGAVPLIVARKMSIAMFPVLKRLGALGFQLHHLYVPDTGCAELVRQAFGQGPKALPAVEAASHPVVSERLPAALIQPAPLEHKAASAIKIAVELGLGEDGNAGIEALREWAKVSGIDMPSPWKGQLTKYRRWLSKT